MICSECRTENDAGRKFCIECGGRLATGCPVCGAKNPDEAKFCGDCGGRLGPGGVSATVTTAPRGQPSAAAGSTSERRLVTVLFADLVGFTTLASDQDPEDTREFLTRYFDLTRAIVERHGGTIEKFIGDAVMAVWGAPTAHEDDAERAVRAALDIVDGVPALGDRSDVQVRAGILTGEAAVTLGASGQGMVAGDMVNTASRLQSIAPPGTVLVGEATYRAASGAIAFEPAGEQLLKGKSAPVPAWRAAAVVALRRGSGRREALEPPFIGRDEELRLLKELFHATERERKVRLVSIVGQAGIGKSRLAWEFEKYIDGVVDQVWWHAGRSPAYGDGISYWALAEMVRGRAGIAESDDPNTARGLLSATVVEWVADETERRWIEPRLAALLALEPMPPGSRDELFAAWRTFFVRIAERGPTVLLFEDIQWADEGMLDFVEELLEATRTLPLFVITLARPELFERRTGWGSNMRSFTAMGLEPLEAGQIAEMVRRTVPGISEDALDAIVARAEGIPLYAVETVRMLIDRGDLRPVADGQFEITGEIDRLAVPETLHALIAARLDGLSDHERRLLQAAAVVGQSFTIETLGGVFGQPVEDLRESLQMLVRRQILRVEADPRSPERGQYAFVQAVVKEVAEGSLSRADRRALHLAAARHYESIGDDELAGVLASHYIEAYRSAPAGPEADAIAAQARVTLRAAAERASSLHSHAQALSYLEQALAVTTDASEQALIHERAARAAENLGRLDTVLDHAREAERLHRAAGDPMGALRAITQQASGHLDDHSERPAIAILVSSLQEVGDLGKSSDVARAQAQLGRALMMGGQAVEAIERCSQVLAAPSYLTDEELIEVLVTKGTALSTLDTALEGEVVLRGAIDVADRLGLTSSALRARNNLLGVVQLDDLNEAAKVIRESFALAERFGLRRWSVQFAHVGLTDGFERGDWDAWLQETQELGLTVFYRAWRDLEVGIRGAFRGQLDEGQASYERAVADIGTTSSQADTGMASSAAAIAVAAGRWQDVMPYARLGWSHYDSTTASVAWAIVAGIAAREPAWISEAAEQLAGEEWRGRYPEALRSFAGIASLLAEGRIDEAMTRYGPARRAFDETGAGLWRAMLDLAVGLSGAGNVPESAQALTEAERFFDSVGARAFLDRYRESMVEVVVGTDGPRDESASATPAVSSAGSA